WNARLRNDMRRFDSSVGHDEKANRESSLPSQSRQLGDIPMELDAADHLFGIGSPVVPLGVKRERSRVHEPAVGIGKASAVLTRAADRLGRVADGRVEAAQARALTGRGRAGRGNRKSVRSAREPFARSGGLRFLRDTRRRRGGSRRGRLSAAPARIESLRTALLWDIGRVGLALGGITAAGPARLVGHLAFARIFASGPRSLPKDNRDVLLRLVRGPKSGQQTAPSEPPRWSKENEKESCPKPR